METITVGNHLLGGDLPFVIAEAGVNHDGDVAKAHTLIDVAAEAGAGSVKFQTFEASSLVAENTSSAPYQERATGSSSQSELLQALSLPRSAWRELSDHASEKGLLFLSTPFDLASADLLLELGVPALKVPSGELTNLAFIRRLAELGVPLLISTGMASLDEVGAALEAAAAAPGRALFHCVSAYPAPFEDCNLLAIPAMAEQFDVPVGWSDHTAGSTAAVASAALGARIFEKHFTLDSTAPGPDHAASLEPEELAEYISDVSTAVQMLGDGKKRRMPSEFENAPLVRRSWHVRRDLPAGHVISTDDVIALRPETGVSVAVDIVGRTTTRAVATGDALVPDAVTAE
ncbi:N-acetylneuraminate synthase family protein [Humibacter sp. RRB41]|uniref:N-acetylneuraminate synthase family protein n=1 Tax=Humibacter sp. RRB41 TaxID=2919946 RepID=UPI001FA9A4C5|nr:N-acetylneuraminate synthase family protein [Humibacter sp. RRB41]